MTVPTAYCILRRDKKRIDVRSKHKNFDGASAELLDSELPRLVYQQTMAHCLKISPLNPAHICVIEVIQGGLVEKPAAPSAPVSA